jgi:hypothetical protein
MSMRSDKTKEQRIENVILGPKKRVRPREESQELIRSAAALSKALNAAARSYSGPGDKGRAQQSGKVAQAIALQKALLPDLAKRGRGRYKSDLRAPGRSNTGNPVKRSGGQKPSRSATPKTPTSRPKMSSGGVTFHFKHTFVSKGMAGSDPSAKEPGTAAAHQRYIEREQAVERDEGGQPLEIGTLGDTLQERRDFWGKLEDVERADGRVQCRLVMEMPHELTARQRHEILQGFAKVLGDRGLPHYAVLHQPDEGSDDRNYHAHLVYSDRPAKRLEDGSWDFEQRETRQLKDREARGGIWVRQLRHDFARLSNKVLESAGVEKRLDPRSYRDAGVEKTPEKHLGSTLSALERQGYVSREGVHNARSENDYQTARVLQRSRDARRQVHERLQPSRELLKLARNVPDEAVQAGVKELRELVFDYLANERFMIGLTRRKALLQAKKRGEIARPWQTKNWAERELEQIDGGIEKNGLSAKTKRRRAGIRNRLHEAQTVLQEVNDRYEGEWLRLTALDPKVAKVRTETKQILTMLEATRASLSIRLSSAEVRGEMAQRAEGQLTKPSVQTFAPKITVSHKTSSSTVRPPFRVQIRATLPGLALTTSRDAARQKDPGVVDGAPLMPLPSGPTFPPPEVATTPTTVQSSADAQQNEKPLSPTTPIPEMEKSTRKKPRFTPIQRPKLKR